MIFPKLENITTKSDKEFFIEKCNILIRLVECYATKFGLSIPSTVNNNKAIEQLLDFGIIRNAAELPTLKNLLGKNLYDILIRACSFIDSNPGVKVHLIKLNNLNSATL